MDTKPQAVAPTRTDIPNFKLAKVGEKQERKKGGIPWLPAAGAGGKLSFASVLGCKAGLLALIGLVSGAGISYNNEQYANSKANSAANTSKISAVHRPRADYEGDLSKLPKDPNAGSRGDGMNMVSGSLDGKTPEQRAAEAAAAAEAAEKARLAEEARLKAEADAQAKADADAAAAAEAQAKADADAAAAAAASGQAGGSGGANSSAASGSGSTGLGGRIGALGSGGGGGGSSALSGGAGLSGGINKSFGGGGSAGGFKGANKGSRITGSSSRGGRATQLGRVRGRGIGDKGLNRINNLVRPPSTNEGGASNAQTAFDGARPAGTGITGAGAGSGGAAGAGGAGAGGGNTGGGGMGQPGPAGPGPGPGPTVLPPVTCGPGTHIENGVCMPDAGKNTTPWQGLVDSAKLLLKIAGIALLLAMILAMIGNKLIKSIYPPTVAWGLALLKWSMLAAKVALVAAGAATMLGIMICVQHGQWAQGGLITILGGITTFFAYKSIMTVDASSENAAKVAKSKAAEKAATIAVKKMLYAGVSAAGGAYL